MKSVWQMDRPGPQIGAWCFLKIMLMLFLIVTMAGAA
jgi:hypothetical protein